VSAGELIVLPPNVPHAFEALEPTIDLDFFSPPRADWERGDEGYLAGAEA
jgi:quercetin dioxygenase-like cupin family protein